MLTLEKLQLVNKMTTQLAVCQINPISKKHCKMIAIDLSNQRGGDADPKATQQINFSRNLVQDGGQNTTLLKQLKMLQVYMLHFML